MTPLQGLETKKPSPVLEMAPSQGLEAWNIEIEKLSPSKMDGLGRIGCRRG